MAITEEYVVSEYPPAFGLLAVPVLPPTLYPSTLKAPPPPLSTTYCMISFISSAVSFDTVCRTTSVSKVFTVFPLESCKAFTRRGFIILPSLPNEEMAVISWIGVTAIPCPNPIVARPTGPAFSLVCSSAVVSPGKSIPVVPVIPKVPKCS